MPVKFSDFIDVFLEKSANVLQKRTGANKHPIELKKGKQPAYGPIYSLGPIELKTVKTYIKTYLANSFIWASKLSASARILFIRKPDGSFCLCVNYHGLNNPTIKSQYLLPFIGKCPGQLDRAKRFIQLELTSAYHQMRIKDGNEWKTAFRTWYSHFKHQVMAFGLSNALTSFQAYINKIVAVKFNIFIIVYFDDIFINTKDQS